jgi:hypothetical protein
MHFGRSSLVGRWRDDPVYHVYRVSLPEGLRDVVSLLPEEIVFASGLKLPAIVGVCTELVSAAVPLSSNSLRPNPEFVKLVHEIIASNGPGLPELQAAATEQVNGWVYVIDARTPTPAGDVPPEDILGRFEVNDGRLVSGSYQPSPNHQVWSSRGLFKLDDRLQVRLLERLREIVAQPDGVRPADSALQPTARD